MLVRGNARRMGESLRGPLAHCDPIYNGEALPERTAYRRAPLPESSPP